MKTPLKTVAATLILATAALFTTTTSTAATTISDATQELGAKAAANIIQEDQKSYITGGKFYDNWYQWGFYLSLNRDATNDIAQETEHQGKVINIILNCYNSLKDTEAKYYLFPSCSAIGIAASYKFKDKIIEANNEGRSIIIKIPLGGEIYIEKNK